MTNEDRKREIKALARRLPDLLSEAVDHGYTIKQSLEQFQDDRLLDQLPEPDLERVHAEVALLCDRLESAASIARGVTVMMSEMSNGES